VAIPKTTFLDIGLFSKNTSLIIAFLSGGVDIEASTCSDMVFNQAKIDIPEDIPKVISITSFPIETKIISALSDYASIVLTISGKPYFFLHGGISCDFETIYSSIYTIDLSEYNFFRLNQRNMVE
jgi:hypothetical protein